MKTSVVYLRILQMFFYSPYGWRRLFLSCKDFHIAASSS